MTHLGAPSIWRRRIDVCNQNQFDADQKSLAPGEPSIDIEGVRADPTLAADLGSLHPAFVIVKERDDLFLCETRFAYVRRLLPVDELTFQMRDLSGRRSRQICNYFLLFNKKK